MSSTFFIPICSQVLKVALENNEKAIFIVIETTFVNNNNNIL